MAQRKLQQEIDKTLKKVAEGAEAFDGIYEKMMATTHQAQKEKLEADLKTQIKKLQRLRDQIKTWVASNEIKDKSLLLDNRKLIEVQMERFKACEKEIKTKAFSKEGLIAQARLDPHEKLKLEVTHWLGGQVEELGRQMEATDAEVEQIAGSTKKKSAKAGSAGNRIAELEHLNERRKWHVNRLELMLRLLENGNLDVDLVQHVKEDIAYFVESNAEEDFEEDLGIYDDLNLDAEEEAYGMTGDDVQSSHDSQSVADTSDIVTNATPSKPAAPKERSASIHKAKKEESVSTDSSDQQPPSQSAGDRSPTSARVGKPPSAQPSRKSTLESITPKTVPKASPTLPAQVSSPAPAAPQPRQAPVVLPPIRYSAAAAAAVASQTPPAAAPSSTAPPATSSTIAPGVLPTHSANVKVLPAQSPASALKSPTEGLSMAPPPGMSEAARPIPQSASSTAGPSPSLSSASLATSSLQNQQQQASSITTAAPSISPAPSGLTQSLAASPEKREPSLPEQTAPSSRAPSAASLAQQQAAEAARFPEALSDLVVSFENAKQRASVRQDKDMSTVAKLLESGYSNVPQPTDAEKPKYYVPKQPWATPAYYPQQPMPALESPNLFAKFDVDTLFYIFYYQVGSYMQYLAAEELKRRAWRFHKQYLTWFQRANEPQAITDEYEQGVYLYFDWETAWSTRKKNSFTFAYKFLEDETY